jgi:hypothetical protein
MPFACCASCGHVISRRPGRAEYGRPIDGCPECGRAMYWTATPSPQAVLGRWEAARQHTEPIPSARVQS